MAEPLRGLSGEELAWIADSVAALLRQQPEASGHAGFDDAPDGFIRELRAALPC